MHKSLYTAILIALLGGSAAACAQHAPVKVEAAWARASVAGQSATGAFMRLTAAQDARLVRAESPAAGVTELHQMKLEGEVMKMRPVPALELPAGQPVELKPGGYHIMLMDLKAPLAKGSTVPLKLVLQDAQGRETSMDLSLPVLGSAPEGADAAASAPMGGHKH